MIEEQTTVNVDTKNGHSRFVPVDEGIFLYIKNRLGQRRWKECGKLKTTGTKKPVDRKA